MKKNIEGYLTIETAFIFPIITCGILMVVHALFWLYLGCISSQDAFILAARSNIYGKNLPIEANAYVSAVKDEWFAQKYVASGALNVETIEDDECVHVKISSTSMHALMDIFSIFNNVSWEYKSSACATGYNRGTLVRETTRLIELVKNGYSQVNPPDSGNGDEDDNDDESGGPGGQGDKGGAAGE